MAAYHELPEQVLSRNAARYLLTRNAGEKELLRRTSFLLDKAKSEEEKGFERERDRLLQRRSKIPDIQTLPPQVKFNVGRKILCRNEVETEKWEVGSDIKLFPKKRRKRGLFLNNKPLDSSEVLFDHSSTAHCCAAIEGQTWTRRTTSFSCTLPAIPPPRSAYSQENKARKWKKQLKTSPLTEKKKTNNKTLKKQHFQFGEIDSNHLVNDN